MPQVGGHLIIAEKVKNALSNPQYLDSHLNAYRLGAIGPDLALFLLDPLGGVSSVIDFAVDVYSTIKKIKEIFSEIKEKALDPALDLADWFTGGLSTSLIDTIKLGLTASINCAAINLLPGTEIVIENPFAGIALKGLPQGKTMVVKANDLSVPLRCFGHPYTNDPPYKDPAPVNRPEHYDKFWWVDLLHYRRTGAFAQALLANAGSDLLRAYATGYFTHVAGDVCGHPYVNAVVGGAYRNHAIRHMVMENVIDTWLWDFYKSADLLNAGLNKHVDVGSQFEQIANHLNRIADSTYINCYPPSFQPTYFKTGHLPTLDDWDRAYKLFLLYLESATNAGIERPQPPPGSPGEFFEEISNSIERTFGNLKKQFNFSSMSWWEWLLAPFLAALYALSLLAELVTLPAAILTRLFALYPRWVLYEIQMLLYDYIVNARWDLALSGWGKVSQEDLQRPFATLCYHIPPHRAGQPGAYDYPHALVPRDQGFWLRDPKTANVPVEATGPTEASPYAQLATPDIFVDGPPYYQQENAALRQFAGFSSPQYTKNLEFDTAKHAQLGNAVNFAVMLLSNNYPITSFDLDSDMGYGYLAWEGPPPDYKQGL